MGFLTRVDNAILGAIEKVFRVKRPLQPIDVAILLKRAVSSSEIKLPYDTYIPDRWTVLLPEQMYDDVKALLTAFNAEVERYLNDYIQPKGYKTVQGIKVLFDRNSAARNNEVLIRGAFSKARGDDHNERTDHKQV